MSIPAAVEDLCGRTIVVTGATSGIGAAAAVELARRGGRIVVIGRNEQRLNMIQQRIAALSPFAPIALRADFTRLDEIHALGARLSDRFETIDVLVGNAGGLSWSRSMTVDGFETTIQTNHLAGFLLANLIREQLARGRMILTTSESYTDGRLDPGDLNGDAAPYAGGAAYGSSKQANIAFAREAARRWPDILAVSFHPGEVRTRFGRGTLAAPYFRFNPFLRSAAKGADTLVWLASAPRTHLESGGYYHDRTLRTVSGPTADHDLARTLWENSCKAVGLDIEDSQRRNQ